MIEYVRQLPTDAQTQSVDHVRMNRVIIDTGFINAEQVEYGTLDENGEFQMDPVATKHDLDLRGEELTAFLESESGIDSLPTLKEDTIIQMAESLATYADQNDLWQTQQ